MDRWSKVIEEVIGTRLHALKPADRTALAARQAAYLARCYGITTTTTPSSSSNREEESSGGGGSFNLKAEGGGEGGGRVIGNEALQLPKGVFEVNLGLPIIVVGLKADLVQVGMYVCSCVSPTYLPKVMKGS